MATGTVSTLDRLTPPVRGRLAALTHSVDYPAGADVQREGSDTPFLGEILHGRIALRLRVPERGDRYTIVTIEPGELVGWSAVVAPYRATADAVAAVPTRLLEIDAGALRAAMAVDCELAEQLLPLVLTSVSERLTASWQQLLDLIESQVREPW